MNKVRSRAEDTSHLSDAPGVLVRRDLPASKKQSTVFSNWLVSSLSIALGLVAIFLFLQWDRKNQVSSVILAMGALAPVAATVLMAILCLLPVPSEFLLIIEMRVFGPWWGALYGWLGSMAGAIGTFWIARRFGGKVLQRFVSDKRIAQVDSWVGRRGVVGLLLARIVPLPYIVVNYVAGTIASVRIRDFIWTSAVGGVPYFLGAALIFLGVSRKYIWWLAVGLIAIVAVWVLGYLYNLHVHRVKRWAH